MFHFKCSKLQTFVSKDIIQGVQDKQKPAEKILANPIWNKGHRSQLYINNCDKTSSCFYNGKKTCKKDFLKKTVPQESQTNHCEVCEKVVTVILWRNTNENVTHIPASQLILSYQSCVSKYLTIRSGRERHSPDPHHWRICWM